MASFHVDQAEGLRRMLGGPKPRVFTFLSAAGAEEKASMLINLGASLARGGSDVMLFDARGGGQGIASRMDAARGATLQQVARQERALDEMVTRMPQGFGVGAMQRGPQQPAVPAELVKRMDQAFRLLAGRADIVAVDAELSREDELPLPALAGGELVVQVSTRADSITGAYAIIKRLCAQAATGSGRRFSIVVTGAAESEARAIFQNMAKAASRYLCVDLQLLGHVPADDHVGRAARLGRSVVDAFPMAGAAVAFRRLADKFQVPDVHQGGLHAISANGSGVRY
ncbi:flagellar biosynthesis protein FlhG [Noviherbaspirillum humi]|uniref:Flagellar biosynthesis protein FlhG n=1 Tax=Noviherbaspirillum humi TaxID=1688639 RepID=A0A239FUZ8_9BURK|nr:antiactivator of flagellar biosynthesis FleN protein [Noviherbaspirillum humi]SNS60701.1 flagellar biosynthesis protein FlhG [Noviherbaspirillum humi]